MSFKGYKLTFEFNAAHSNIENTAKNLHFHTFSLVFFLNPIKEEGESFSDIEKNIREWIRPYQDVYLPETDLFKGRSTTIENIADTFYELWNPELLKLGFDLVRLDIFENPIRTYSVSDRLLDADVNELEAFPYAFSGAVEYEPEIKDGTMAVISKEEQDRLNEAFRVWDERELMEILPDEESLSEEELRSAKEEERDIIPGRGKRALVILYCALAAVIAVILSYVMMNHGIFPKGKDTYSHLYRGALVYNSIKNGNPLPLYDPYLYNGMQIMRFHGPLPVFLLALLQMASGGSIYGGYAAYMAVVFFLGVVGFTLLGYREDRVGMGFFTGILWFFLPVSTRIFFTEGKIDISLALALLPYLLCVMRDAIKRDKKYGPVLIAAICALMSLCHVGMTLISIGVSALFFLYYKAGHKKASGFKRVIASSLCGVMMSGIWLVPFVLGGGTDPINKRTMEDYFQSIFVSLNPLNLWNGKNVYYFGLAVFTVIILGLILGTRDAIPGFATALTVFLLTGISSYRILSNMPYSSFLRMMSFTAPATAFFLYAVISWRGLKKYIVVLLCLVLCADAVFGLRFIYDRDGGQMTPYERDAERAAEMSIDPAKSVTGQRMAIMDQGSYGAFAPYYIASYGKRVKYLYGAENENAGIKENISMIDTALEYGWYDYVFDRLLETGTDTVVIPVESMAQGRRDADEIIEAGRKFGFEVEKNTENELIMSIDVPENFGTVTDYPYIAIGHSARTISFIYPAFEEGESDNINDYSFDFLKSYDIIYLSDFVYDDKDKAEKLLNDLADEGVKIFVDMYKIPKNPQTGVFEFMGVSTQTFMYSASFPTIIYGGLGYKTASFPADLFEWKGNYLIGLTDETGYGSISRRKLSFCGHNGNDNITFLGYNFLYYAEETGDTAAVKLINEVFGIENGCVPEREIVPIEIGYGNNSIEIKTDRAGVNTSLADIPDMFVSDREYTGKNGYVIADKGVTKISMHYPFLLIGSIVSLLGIVFTGIIVKSKDRYKRKALL